MQRKLGPIGVSGGVLTYRYLLIVEELTVAAEIE